MTSQKTATESGIPVKQVNSILQNLRGEHFRHARNVQGKPVSSISLSSHSHNQPTLPINLVYPSAAPTTSSSWVPGPDPPRSWQSPVTSSPSPGKVKSDADMTNSTAWRERALLPLFSADTSSSESARTRPIYPDPNPIPQLTLLCLQLIRATVPGADLVEVAPYIPPHLRRALLRYTAVHAPLSRTELDALRQGTAHIDTELIVIGPHNTLRASWFRKGLDDHDPNVLQDDSSELDSGGSWDAVPTQDNEPLVLRSLAVLSSPLSAATVLAFPPTITHLALINVLNRVSLQRLPTICPLLVFLDLSYNAWSYGFHTGHQGASMLEEIEWSKLRRLKVIGLRGCPVSAKVLLGLNRGRWEDVQVIQ